MTAYTEINDSQNPALVLLQKLGWQYISPEQTVEERNRVKRVKYFWSEKRYILSFICNSKTILYL